MFKTFTVTFSFCSIGFLFMQQLTFILKDEFYINILKFSNDCNVDGRISVYMYGPTGTSQLFEYMSTYIYTGLLVLFELRWFLVTKDSTDSAQITYAPALCT